MGRSLVSGLETKKLSGSKWLAAVLDLGALNGTLALRLIYRADCLRFAWFRRRFGSALALGDSVSPNLCFATLRLHPSARCEVGSGFATERQPGNRIWLQQDGVLTLGPRVWLRTEYGENLITVYPGARIEVGADSLINAAMLHAKESIRIGSDARIGFGVRILDADMHDLDVDHAEQIGSVEIGDRVWIGADAKILRGVRIGDDSVVGAGSVVTHDIPARTLAAGVPAKPIREIGPRTGCR